MADRISIRHFKNLSSVLKKRAQRFTANALIVFQGTVTNRNLKYIYTEGIYQTHLFKLTHNKYFCQKKDKLQHIAVGTVRTFIEPSAKR